MHEQATKDETADQEFRDRRKEETGGNEGAKNAARKANHLETFFYYHRSSCSASGYEADFISRLTKYSIFRGIGFRKTNSFSSSSTLSLQ